jgi:serine phosphatase RsbU (regulator of sigma subunit)
MEGLLARLSERFWPELIEQRPSQRRIGYAKVLGVIYGVPIAIAGTLWLIFKTDYANWRGFLVPALGLFVFIWLFEQLRFFIVLEIRPGNFANAEGAITGLVIWSALLVFGPGVLWAPLIYEAGKVIWRLPRSRTPSARWEIWRDFILSHSVIIFGGLVGFSAYQLLGGQLPIAGLRLDDLLPAFLAIGIHFITFCAIYGLYIGYLVWSLKQMTPTLSLRRMLGFLVISLALPYLTYPFGILAAGVYSQNSLPSYLFFLFGVMMVAFLGRRLSTVAESSRQQYRQLRQMEQLGRAIINGPPDASSLSEIMQDHVPLMFPSARIIIWVRPDRYLLRHPPEWQPDVSRFWSWIKTQDRPSAFLADSPIPWRRERPPHSPLVVAPITDMATDGVVGGVYLELQPLVHLWDNRALKRLFPGLNALTSQIASAFNKADVYADAIENQRAADELRLAGEIQSGFFPESIPVEEGWELAVTILPARETSGDFFDFIPLPNGKLGILIADVTDKGVGPALYMALSRTLIRTYAIEYELDPSLVFFATNERMLTDTRASLFVTAFFGILDQESGELSYSNAGHNPPLLVSGNGEKELRSLGVTGMPIGIDEQAVWELEKILLEPGDKLVLYTDGVLDAQDTSGEFFESDRLISATQELASLNAHEIQAGLIESVQQFSAGTDQFDDITLMVLVREALDPEATSA